MSEKIKLDKRRFIVDEIVLERKNGGNLVASVFSNFVLPVK